VPRERVVEGIQPVVRKRSPACEKRHSFLSFPYVCPEPVLVK
jgi:hypothetical protein